MIVHVWALVRISVNIHVPATVLALVLVLHKDHQVLKAVAVAAVATAAAASVVAASAASAVAHSAAVAPAAAGNNRHSPSSRKNTIHKSAILAKNTTYCCFSLNFL